MATYYVKTGGSDALSGTSPANAWATIGKVNGTTFSPGDTILFNGGDTFTGGLYFANIASTQASPLTVDSYGTGRATISTAAGSDGCYFQRMGGFVIQNLIFVGPGIATANKDGITIWNDIAGNIVYPYVRVTNCTVSGHVNGIAIGGGSGTSGYSDVRITNCTCHTNSRKGIVAYGVWGSNYALTDVYIGNCLTYGNTGVAGLTTPTGSGIECGSINGGTIEFCTAYGNGAANNFASGPIGIWCWECQSVAIQYCESYNNLSNGGDGGGFDLDGGCKNCIMQYNYSHGNKGGGFGVFQFDSASTFSGNIVRYNISENDQGGGIALWADPGDSLTNTQIYNNTVYNSVAPAFRVLPNTSMTGITVTNNILLTGSGASLVDSQNTTGLTFTKNNYFNLTGAFVIWWGGTSYASRTAWGQDSTGLSVDPGLVNVGSGGTIYPAALTTLTAYKISSGSSPMINAGVSITSPGSKDFWGDTLYSGAPDIGADEYYSGVTDIPGRNKRTSMIGFDALYRARLMPYPDGAITASDRYLLAGKYYGLGIVAAPNIFRNRTASRMRNRSHVN